MTNQTASPIPAQQEPLTPKEAKAAAKAQKAYAKATRPWFKKKRFVLLGLIVLIVIISIASNQGGDTAETPDAAAPAAAGTVAEAPAAVAEEPAPEVEAPGAWADDEYGTFAPVTQAGTGDSVVALPAGAKAGIVTATHDGSANFSVSVIDAANQPTGDLLVNSIGAFSGVTAWGMNAIGGEGTNLQISADGNWTIAINPISTATELAATGTGDAVYLYTGDAANFALTHAGASNFAVMQYAGGFNMPLMVNEIGAYTGTVPFSKGPSVVVIQADGAWTATKG